MRCAGRPNANAIQPHMTSPFHTTTRARNPVSWCTSRCCIPLLGSKARMGATLNGLAVVLPAHKRYIHSVQFTPCLAAWGRSRGMATNTPLRYRVPDPFFSAPAYAWHTYSPYGAHGARSQRPPRRPPQRAGRCQAPARGRSKSQQTWCRLTVGRRHHSCIHRQKRTSLRHMRTGMSCLPTSHLPQSNLSNTIKWTASRANNHSL